MSRKSRKVAFYYLHAAGEFESIKQAFNATLTKVEQFDMGERIREISDKRFSMLNSVSRHENNTRFRLLFKSGTHSFSPPYIDKDSGEERPNQKRLSEAEGQKTHAVAKIINGDIIIVVEKNFYGVSVDQIGKYLNFFLHDQNLHFSHQMILRDNFREVINGLSRISLAEVTTNKVALGSSMLNLSDKTSQVREDIVIGIKAVRKRSIIEFVEDVFSNYSSNNPSVSKIKIEGRNQENNPVIINTDALERSEWVTADLNDLTGEFQTNSMFTELETVLYNF